MFQIGLTSEFGQMLYLGSLFRFLPRSEQRVVSINFLQYIQLILKINYVNKHKTQSTLIKNCLSNIFQGRSEENLPRNAGAETHEEGEGEPVAA